jgi:hypothetical protein
MIFASISSADGMIALFASPSEIAGFESMVAIAGTGVATTTLFIGAVVATAAGGFAATGLAELKLPLAFSMARSSAWGTASTVKGGQDQVGGFSERGLSPKSEPMTRDRSSSCSIGG